MQRYVSHWKFKRLLRKMLFKYCHYACSCNYLCWIGYFFISIACSTALTIHKFYLTKNRMFVMLWKKGESIEKCLKDGICELWWWCVWFSMLFYSNCKQPYFWIMLLLVGICWHYWISYVYHQGLNGNRRCTDTNPVIFWI